MKTVTALVHNPPLLLIVGMIGLIAGLAIVLGHNVWYGGMLPVVVTLVGWLILILRRRRHRRRDLDKHQDSGERGELIGGQRSRFDRSFRLPAAP